MQSADWPPVPECHRVLSIFCWVAWWTSWPTAVSRGTPTSNSAIHLIQGGIIGARTSIPIPLFVSPSGPLILHTPSTVDGFSRLPSFTVSPLWTSHLCCFSLSPHLASGSYGHEFDYLCCWQADTAVHPAATRRPSPPSVLLSGSRRPSRLWLLLHLFIRSRWFGER